MFFRSLLPVPSGFRQSLSGFYRLFLSVLLFLWVDLFTDLFSEISLWAPRFQTAFQRLLRFSLFRIFRVALLFICQGSSASGLPSALLLFSAATLIEYHMSFALSTAFLLFFHLLLSICEAESYVITSPCNLSIVLSRILNKIFKASNRIAPPSVEQGKAKRKLIISRFFSPLDVKRRKRDLNPRAGCPTYTLSRGASSAS